MGYNIGLNIVEVNGSGSPAIVGASTSVAAFNISTQRGVAGQATQVTSFVQFTQNFGTFLNSAYGAYLVKGFFDNGGQTAYINRVVSTDPVSGDIAAHLILPDAAVANALRLDAGMTGQKDPGSWGNSLYVSVAASNKRASRIKETAPATITGAAVAGTVDMSNPVTLSITIDGVATPIAFAPTDFPTPATSTLAQIQSAINRKTSSLIASISNSNQLTLTSTAAIAHVAGVFTSLQVTADLTALGFSKMANPVSGTPAAFTASGTTLATVTALKQGDRISISDGTNSANAKILTINTQTGAITWTPAIATPSNFAALQIAVTPITFDLLIAQGLGDAAHVVETWPGLSMEPDIANYAPQMINDPQLGSSYLVATDLHSPVGSNQSAPAAIGYTALTGGQDGVPTVSDIIGDPVAHTGFYAFDAYDVQLLTSERQDAAIVVAGRDYCANRGDCFYVGATPKGSFTKGTAAAIQYGQAFQLSKAYAALYGPWIAITDPIGLGNAPMKVIPPVGHVLGVYARIADSRGIWKAPAGDEANLQGALDVEYRLTDTEHTALVETGSVNGIRIAPGAGIIIDASRTLSTDTRWLYVNVRLLFNYVKSSLKTGLRWVRQEPNQDSLWSAIRNTSITPFLLQLWRQGAFGSGTAAQTFTVICDATNNPPSQVDQGFLTVEVYFYPSKPAETIVIIVGQQPSGASASES